MASSGSNDIHEAGARSRAFQAQSPREALVRGGWVPPWQWLATRSGSAAAAALELQLPSSSSILSRRVEAGQPNRERLHLRALCCCIGMLRHEPALATVRLLPLAAAGCSVGAGGARGAAAAGAGVAALRQRRLHRPGRQPRRGAACQKVRRLPHRPLLLRAVPGGGVGGGPQGRLRRPGGDGGGGASRRARRRGSAQQQGPSLVPHLRHRAGCRGRGGRRRRHSARVCLPRAPRFAALRAAHGGDPAAAAAALPEAAWDRARRRLREEYFQGLMEQVHRTVPSLPGAASAAAGSGGASVQCA